MNIKGMGVTIGGRPLSPPQAQATTPEPKTETKATTDIPAGEPSKAPASKKKE